MTATKIQVFSSTERNQNRNWQLRLKLHFGNFSRLAIIEGLTNHDARKTMQVTHRHVAPAKLKYQAKLRGFRVLDTAVTRILHKNALEYAIFIFLNS